MEHVAGPYEEGADVILTCEVFGGNPPPEVSWLVNGELVDATSERLGGALTANQLRFPSAQRQHLRAHFTCRAANTRLTPFQEKTVALDLHLRPLSARIVSKEASVSAHSMYQAICESAGSRPAARLSWWKGGRQLESAKVQELSGGNISRSVLTWSPTPDDDGQALTCRAENPLLNQSALEDSWRLSVVYAPEVRLRLGSTLDPSAIKEGDDVYFECHIRANPRAHRLLWLHNDTLLVHNVSSGIIMSNQSLVLQGVTRASSGRYTCLASNSEGEGSSNAAQLTVMFAPVCQQSAPQIVGASREEILEIPCLVEAHPAQVEFAWEFSGAGETAPVPIGRFRSKGSSSMLSHAIMSDLDYGTLLCWGANVIGPQRSPCIFQVVAAGRPLALRNCSLTNQTVDGLEVECEPGFDGGLPQRFQLELYDATTMALRYNSSSEEPVFSVSGLEPGISLRLAVFAVNARGRSEPIVLDAVLLRGLRRHTVAQRQMPLLPLAAILLGAALVLFSTALAVVLTLRRLSRRRMPEKTALPSVPRTQATTESNNQQPISSASRTKMGEDSDPDLIPAVQGTLPPPVRNGSPCWPSLAAAIPTPSTPTVVNRSSVGSLLSPGEAVLSDGQLSQVRAVPIDRSGSVTGCSKDKATGLELNGLLIRDRLLADARIPESCV